MRQDDLPPTTKVKEPSSKWINVSWFFMSVSSAVELIENKWGVTQCREGDTQIGDGFSRIFFA